MNKFHQLLLAGAAVAVLGGASAAQAADLIVSEPSAPAPMAVASGNWAGPYVGIFAGGAMGEADHQPGPNFPGPADGNDIDLSGMLLGVDAGVNFQLSDSVIGGIVGDIAWSNVSGTEDFGGAFDEITHNINWQGSLRGVLGFDGGSIMPYLTGGVAFANADRVDPSLSDDDPNVTHIGWTAGVGVAIAATDTMRINLEYRHSDFGTQTYHYDDIDRDVDVGLTEDAVTIGLNWAL